MSEMAFGPVACRSVFTARQTRPACQPLVMNVFEPLMTYWSLSRWAVVAMPCRAGPAGGRGRSCLAGDRSYVTRSWTETVQPPAGGVPRALCSQDLRRLSGRKRHIETIERHREAVADCLDESFLTGPAVEEPQWLFGW